MRWENVLLKGFPDGCSGALPGRPASLGVRGGLLLPARHMRVLGMPAKVVSRFQKPEI